MDTWNEDDIDSIQFAAADEAAIGNKACALKPETLNPKT
jgi:hypothetical protein